MGGALRVVDSLCQAQAQDESAPELRLALAVAEEALRMPDLAGWNRGMATWHEVAIGQPKLAEEKLVPGQ